MKTKKKKIIFIFISIRNLKFIYASFLIWTKKYISLKLNTDKKIDTGSISIKECKFRGDYCQKLKVRGQSATFSKVRGH